MGTPDHEPVLDFDIAVGDHVCAMYSGPAERNAILRPFLDTGLGAGHKCLIGLQEPDAPSVIRTLGMHADIDRCLATQQLAVLGANDPQFSPDDFSIPTMLAFWDHAVTNANTDGYTAAHLSAEAAWWIPQLPGIQALIAYESELNDLTTRLSAAILCLYDLNDCTGSLVIDLVKTHPRLMINQVVFENPWYLRPEDFRTSPQTHRR
ncbi:MEDS domain-containing protein [Pseudonocardia bannensis]